MSISKLPMMVLSLFFLQSANFSSNLYWATGLIMILLSLGIIQRGLYPRTRRELFSVAGIGSIALLLGGLIYGFVFIFHTISLFGFSFVPSQAVYVGYLGLAASTINYLGV